MRREITEIKDQEVMRERALTKAKFFVSSCFLTLLRPKLSTYNILFVQLRAKPVPLPVPLFGESQ